MAMVTLRKNFRNIDPASAMVTLIEGAGRILPTFSDKLGASAARQLERLGVRIITNAKVEMVDEQGVIVAGQRIESATVLWTAGVAPSSVLKHLDGERDRGGRICVRPDLTIATSDRVFVVGDAASIMQKE